MGLKQLVEFMKQQAVEADLIRAVDMAKTGDVFYIGLAEPGELETQPPMVEIVVLTPGRGVDSEVNYRYSTMSQDDEWEMGTLQDAIDHAKEILEEMAKQQEYDALLASATEDIE